MVNLSTAAEFLSDNGHIATVFAYQPMCASDFFVACFQKLTGDIGFLGGALDMLKQQCLQVIASNVTLYTAADDDDSSIGQLMRTIERNLCVEDCGANGDCIDGKVDFKVSRQMSPLRAAD